MRQPASLPWVNKQQAKASLLNPTAIGANDKVIVILINFMFQDVYEPPPLEVGSISLLQLSYEGEIPYKLERLYPKAHILEGPVVNL